MNMDILYRNRLWFVKHKNAKCHAFPPFHIYKPFAICYNCSKDEGYLV